MPNVVAIIATTCKRIVAIIATDVVAMWGYIRKMPRKPQPPPQDAPAINHWVYDAMVFAGISQTDLAKAMHERKVINSADKSVPNKIVRGTRDVTAEEADAIAEITNFPRLPTSPDSDRDKLMAIYDSLDPDMRPVALSQMSALKSAKSSKPSSDHPEKDD